GHEAAGSPRQPLVEDRQRAGHVARADDIGEAEGDPVDPRQFDVLLAGGLRDRIARARRAERVVEPDRLLQGPRAVAERGLQIDQARNLVSLAGPGDDGVPTVLTNASVAQSSGSL